ncbi:Kinesin-like protein isoform 2 [Actinidia chinensis var. chinensis]|uniref:Kinesin-like protein n=1 Tax=Actinidia chinensis var. chinensis TaxID=1590841 RepID=A0A2R6PZQ7_ACTCC|nr:Kinesin-like protein isoform 1 [Actinidia chinensis var. chinensis]PSR99621.1 Kinesin-like protein isoform 2 [Actinidia chinensis var. chinensis]
MGSSSGDELAQWDAQGSNGQEKIFVAVRLRPLNDRETSRNDVSDWECINSNTVIFKNSIAERSMFPTAYTFDRVFGCDCSTKQLYEEGAKEVTLSVVSGINSTIFAYGQTSSGKTYTMSGITEYTMDDIFDYINKHTEREFVLKFSAMEIYNEAVRDLLSQDSTPLRLLDDPERGTIVEKLTEETLRDWSHLNELLSICEAQRQIGETSLNEMSSRSHQILRLTIESSAREFLGAGNSSTLTASVNFVDLAGSERASQTLSAGSRLKEGCHINRSLLTLGTVIRKLSKGRNGHIPYRDSKLTRILQNSLGGNARTAVICTMSPAHSHVEQSRNTLFFASCAKQVSTNAQVNLVVSDKALVKQLQRELARLENELKGLGSMSAKPTSVALLKEKELIIEKMDKEIKELTKQRDHAQSRLQDLLQSAGEDPVSGSLAQHDHLLEPYTQTTFLDEYSASESSEVVDPPSSDITSNMSHLSDICNGLNKHNFEFSDHSEDQFLSDDVSPRVVIDKLFGPDPSQGWEMIVQKHDEEFEDHCKEVRCIEVEELNMDRNSKSDALSSPQKGNTDSIQVKSEPTYEALKQKIQDMQKTIDHLVSSYLTEQSPSSSEVDMKLSRSRSYGAMLMPIRSSPFWFEKAENNENTPPSDFEKGFPGRPVGDYQPKVSGLTYVSSLRKLRGKDPKISMDKKEQNTEISHEGDVSSVHSSTTELNDVAKSESEQQSGDDLAQEAKSETGELGIFVEDIRLEVQGSLHSPSNWPLEFEAQRREIIEFWDSFNVPLIHRTHFFLLFQGDQSDSIYMEVEIRRLSFLNSALSYGKRVVIDGQIFTRELSKRALSRERQVLSKQILRRFSAKERESLYQKWGIGLNTKKRSAQLSHRVWTDTKDMNHVKDSAALVAKLVGFAKSDETPKEIFGMSFAPRPVNRRSFSWKHNVSSLM